MIINQEALARLYTGFTAVFNAAFQDTETWRERVAMTVPANTRIMDYKFLLDFPMVREWIGDRQISSLEPQAYQVESKDWEATIEVDRNDIEDDQLGFYNPIVSALAQEARKHPEKLIADLLGGGFTTTCYDGHNFFAADHPVGDAMYAVDDQTFADTGGVTNHIKVGALVKYVSATKGWIDIAR